MDVDNHESDQSKTKGLITENTFMAFRSLYNNPQMTKQQIAFKIAAIKGHKKTLKLKISKI